MLPVVVHNLRIAHEVIAEADANEKGLACAKRAAAYSIAVQEQA
jgi:hypothetical protein